MASAINAVHPTDASATERSASSPANAAIICDVCRKHGSVHEESPQESVEKHPDAGHFDCNICLDGCHDPVVTLCGHLFCWPCLFSWLSLSSVSQECPVCRANVHDRIVPLYGRGRGIAAHSMNSAAMTFPIIQVPCRPSPRRSDVPVIATNAITDHTGQLHNHAIQASATHTRRAAPSASMLGCGMNRQRRSFSNKKEFVFHWAFILVASIAIVWFIVS